MEFRRVLFRSAAARAGARTSADRTRRDAGEWRQFRAPARTIGRRPRRGAGAGAAGVGRGAAGRYRAGHAHRPRSEEHKSELQSLMRISYAVLCLKKKHINMKPNDLSTITSDTRMMN